MFIKQVISVALHRNRPKCMSMNFKDLSSLSRNMVSSVSRQTVTLDHEQSVKLLNILNSTASKDLIKYPISKGRIEKIQSWKTKHGHFESIDQLLQLDGFGMKMLEKFCTNILQYDASSPPTLKSATSKRGNAFTVPPLPATSRHLYKSCVSIFTTVSSVMWARIELDDNAPCRVTHWHHYNISDKRPHLSELIQHCRYINRLIPDADCYVLENVQVAQGAAPGSAEQVNINVQKAQLTALLNYALAYRTDQSSDDTKVFYLKKFLCSRIFNTLVGTERVSTEQVVLELMRTHYNYMDSIPSSEETDPNDHENIEMRSNINVPMELRTLYQDAEKYQRDFLGQALLIGMAFIRLCILRTPSSLAIVSRNFKDGS